MTAISPADGSPGAPTVTAAVVVTIPIPVPSMVSSMIDQLHFRSVACDGVR